jgi:hypothetical protein
MTTAEHIRAKMAAPTATPAIVVVDGPELEEPAAMTDAGGKRLGVVAVAAAAGLSTDDWLAVIVTTSVEGG